MAESSLRQNNLRCFIITSIRLAFNTPSVYQQTAKKSIGKDGLIPKPACPASSPLLVSYRTATYRVGRTARYIVLQTIDNNRADHVHIDLPRAEFTGELPIEDLHIPCAVLPDGTRLLTQRGVFVALGRNKNPTTGQASMDDRPAFLAAKNLEPFIPDRLRELWAPVKFRSTGGYRGNIGSGT